MNKDAMVAIIVLLALFGGFMTWLHYKEIALIDRMQHCASPTSRVA